MKKYLITLLGVLCAFSAAATETIKIYSPYSPGHSGTPALYRVIEEANASQNIYNFVVEFKPGGNQIIALKTITPENSLAIIAPAYVDNIATGKINEKDYVSVHAFGDACWAVVSNKSLVGQREFVVGGVGIGNAAHLTGLALGEKYQFAVRYIIFKSNYDALVNMAGNNGVELVIDKYEGYESLKTRNSKMNMIAASCPKRLEQAPKVKTLKELGVDAPYIFNITVAHRDMNSARRQAIGTILTEATQKIGAEEIYKLSAMRPPVFDNISAQEFYNKSIQNIQRLQKKYKDKINTQ
jgi:tripartite-type tricarboxylate transporter receptor subunit TctC